jgi:hypothetical protein
MSEGTDAAAIERIVAQADYLADQILAVEVPEVALYYALQGLVNWGNGSACFTPSERHLEALQRLPAAEDMRLWQEREARMAAISAAS